MADIAALGAAERDEHFLRRSFDVARRALSHGNHPFGAVLVGNDGTVLLEAENGYMPAHDGTAHAERLLATEACRALSREERGRATLYSSAEPCAMCAGAIYWAGIARVVYGLSERRLRTITGNHPENPTLDLPCREVFRRGQRPTEVVGPLLENKPPTCTRAPGTSRDMFAAMKKTPREHPRRFHSWRSPEDQNFTVTPAYAEDSVHEPLFWPAGTPLVQANAAL